jgi:signal-transduction protein with cAMP-binding, CBS, and nucleotidyltransferase domain
MHNIGKQTTDPSTEALIALLEAPPIFAKLEARETDALSSLTVIENDFAADAAIIRQGERIRSLHLVRSGWGCVYRDLSSGERQIIDFPMRSDFLGLRTADGYQLQHPSRQLRPCRFSRFRLPRLKPQLSVRRASA